MIDISKIRKLIDNWNYYKIDCRYDKSTRTYVIKLQEKKYLKDKIQMKEVYEKTVNKMENELKSEIDDKGYYMVDGIIYDYQTNEHIRDATEREVELLYDIRNMKRIVKKYE